MGAYCIRAGLHGYYSCSNITARFPAPDSCSIRPCQIILLIYDLIKKHSSSKETLNLNPTRSLPRTLNNNTCLHQVTKSSSTRKSYESCQTTRRDESCGFVKAVQSLLTEDDIFHWQSARQEVRHGNLGFASAHLSALSPVLVFSTHSTSSVFPRLTPPAPRPLVSLVGILVQSLSSHLLRSPSSCCCCFPDVSLRFLPEINFFHCTSCLTPAGFVQCSLLQSDSLCQLYMILNQLIYSLHKHSRYRMWVYINVYKCISGLQNKCI